MNEPKDPEAVKLCFDSIVEWLFPARNVPTNNPGTGSKPLDEAVTILRSIDAQLKTLTCSDSESDTENHERTKRPRGD